MAMKSSHSGTPIFWPCDAMVVSGVEAVGVNLFEFELAEALLLLNGDLIGGHASPSWPSAHRCRVLAITHVESALHYGAGAGPAYAFLRTAATVLASICSFRNDFSCERHT